jgi:hypothetical protein
MHAAAVAVVERAVDGVDVVVTGRQRARRRNPAC